MDLVYQIASVAGGILLGIDTLDKWDGGGDIFKKAEKFLMPYNTIIGGVLTVMGIMNLLRPGCMLTDIVGIAAGILLFTEVLSNVPAVGDLFKKASGILTPFKAVIGVAILILGATSLFGINPLC